MTTRSSNLSRRCVLGTDIERYGHRSAPDQHEAQNAYHEAIRDATADAGLKIADWIRQPTGDGELMIAPEGVHEPRIVGAMLPALAARLREYNRPRAVGHRVRVKVAVHNGLIHLDGPTGFPGTAAVVVGRLLDADPVRSVLRRLPAVNVAAIVSAEVYRDVVLNRYAQMTWTPLTSQCRFAQMLKYRSRAAYGPVRHASPSRKTTANSC